MPEPAYKRCVTCEASKPTGEFYRNREARDGLTSECKECRKSRSRTWRQEHGEQARANGRRWEEENREHAAELRRRWEFENAERRAKQSRRWLNANRETKRASGRRWRRKNPDKAAAASRRYRHRYPDKVKARNALNHAVRDGYIQKPDCCERCRARTATDQLHGHHHDYSLPLDVEWLCVTCHNLFHNPAQEGGEIVDSGVRTSRDSRSQRDSGGQ